MQRIDLPATNHRPERRLKLAPQGGFHDKGKKKQGKSSFFLAPVDKSGNQSASFLGSNCVDFGKLFCHAVTITGDTRVASLTGFVRAGEIMSSVVQEFLEMTSRINRFMKGLWKHEEGATAIEYGLIAALLAVVIIAAVALVGTDLSNLFNQIGNQL